MSKKYINEERAHELFEEEFNKTYTAIEAIFLHSILNAHDFYAEAFQLWLEDNELHCQQKEYDKYEKDID